MNLKGDLHEEVKQINYSPNMPKKQLHGNKKGLEYPIHIQE